MQENDAVECRTFSLSRKQLLRYQGYILWVGRKQLGGLTKAPQVITPINYLVSM